MGGGDVGDEHGAACLPESALCEAASLALASRHPLAAALVRAAEQRGVLPKVEGLRMKHALLDALKKNDLSEFIDFQDVSDDTGEGQ